MTQSPSPSVDEVAVKPWPLFGYAPGRYRCQCVVCQQMFEGDKRAVHCLECAARAANASLVSPPKAGREEPRGWEGYWPGAGSINSVTMITRHERVMRQWVSDGAEITPLYANHEARGDGVRVTEGAVEKSHAYGEMFKAFADELVTLSHNFESLDDARKSVRDFARGVYAESERVARCPYCQGSRIELADGGNGIVLERACSMCSAALPPLGDGRAEIVEECARLCDAEAELRFAQARKADDGDTSWGIDTHASSIAQDNKAITARGLAAAIRALSSPPKSSETPGNAGVST